MSLNRDHRKNAGRILGILLLLTISVHGLSRKPSAHEYKFTNFNLNLLKNPKSFSSTHFRDSELVKLKELQNAKKDLDCISLSEKKFKSGFTHKFWLLPVWSECLLHMKTERFKADRLARFINAVRSSGPALRAANPWKSLRGNLLRLLESGIEDLEFRQLPTNFDWVDFYAELADDKETRGKALLYYGKIALRQGQNQVAIGFFQSGLQLYDLKVVRELLSDLLGKDNKVEPETKQEFTEADSDSESKILDRLKDLPKGTEGLTGLEDIGAYLQSFPNGKKAKWATDKLQDALAALIDQKAASGNTDNSLQKMIATISRMDPLKIFEFAKFLHRRADFAVCHRLSPFYVEALSKSPISNTVLFVAGRCAQLSGAYIDAIQYFQKYQEFDSAAEELTEVKMRLALSYIRVRDYNSSIALLDRLLASKAGEKIELPARYWLGRSLADREPARAIEEFKKLITKYPFSYYGLRVKAELAGGELEAVPSLTSALLKTSQRNYFLTPQQNETWKLVLTLASSGWIAEAIQEFLDLPQPTDPITKIQLASVLVRVGLDNLAIRMINEAMDQMPSLQTVEALKLGLPVDFEDQVREQSVKLNMNPWLVFSLIRQESAFNPRATSTSKAMGLMQLIPPTAAEVVQDLGMSGVELPQDAYIPEINIRLGTSYLAKMLKQFNGIVPLALAAYNAGPQRLSSFVRSRPELSSYLDSPTSDPYTEIWIEELPWLETNLYVKAILRNTMLYRLKSGDKLRLPALLWSDMKLTP